MTRHVDKVPVWSIYVFVFLGSALLKAVKQDTTSSVFRTSKTLKFFYEVPIAFVIVAIFVNFSQLKCEKVMQRLDMLWKKMETKAETLQTSRRAQHNFAKLSLLEKEFSKQKRRTTCKVSFGPDVVLGYADQYDRSMIACVQQPC